MLKFGNKEFRNLQEQVLENMKDIANLQEGTAVLSEFGIKVVGEVETLADLPTVLEYKSEHEDWAYGDAYAVGTESPYTLYILTRENDTHDEDYWFDIGVFPAPGPQGEQGPKGDQGIQGQTGPAGADGLDAGFGSITATAETLSAGSPATASVTVSGPNTAKELAFTFGIPQNTPAGFTHYVTITASTIVGTQATGTLTLAQYNTLYDNYDAVVRLRSSSSLANNYYFLKKWYTSDDYIVFLGVWSLNNNDTRYYLLKIDRSNRHWTLDVGLPIKITSYNINSTSATIGQVLTADGTGGASWTSIVPPSVETITLSTSTGTLSTDDYNKAAGESCVIIYQDSSGTNLELRKYDETTNTIQYASIHGDFLSPDTSTRLYKLTITKSSKHYELTGNHLPITNSNIKSGSYVSGLVLTTNGSGGSSWESLPTPTALAWGNITGTLSNQTDLKNALDDKQDELTEPDTPTGTIYEYLGFTSAGVVSKNTMVPVSKISDIADVAITGSYTDLLNQPSIPDPQVQSNWTQTNSSKIDYIKNKPDLSIYAQSSSLAAVATSGDYNDLTNKPTIPAAQVNSDWDAASGVAQILNKPNLATVAISGSYADLTNKPTIQFSDTPYSGTTYSLKGIQINGDNWNLAGGPTSATSVSTSTSTVTPTTSAFVTGITPTTDTWTFALSDGTSVQKTIVLGVTESTSNAMTGATVATTTTTTTTLS